MVTIGVKNTFYSVSWEAIAVALHKMRVPDYLSQIFKSDFQTDFADDVILTVIGEVQEEVEMLATVAIGLAEDWKEVVKLKITLHKTEASLVSKCKAFVQAEIFVGGHAVASHRTQKHLGVMLDVQWVERSSTKR